MGPALGKIAVRGALPAALLGAVSAAWYQFLKRPLPKTSGRLFVPGLESTVDVLRDRYGVPHIRARTEADMIFALGFCHGQDRLWQLEFFRRATSGRLSEFAGPQTLDADRAMLTLGMRRAAVREAAAIPPALRDTLDAYAAGINAAVENARAMPLEFQILRIGFEPWTTVDLLAAAKLLAFGLSTNWEMELLRAELIRVAGPERAARLEPQYPRNHPIVTAPGVPYPGDGNDLMAQIARVRESLGLPLPATGSNNWVVSADRTTTGAPLLACDPHLTLTIPDLWYEADLCCDDFRVRGATLPTNPYPAFGQTEHVAWGFTNVMADVQDLFAERLDPDGTRYEFDGGWRDLEIVREEIKVKGRSPEVFEVRSTHHGPLVNGVLGARAESPLALSWTGLQHPCLSLAGNLSVRARSGEELVAATAEHTVPALNMLWADSGGNIGYQCAGRIPVRRGGTPDLPRPGWDAGFEWDGTIPYEELPHLVNPESGYIVTANNRIVDDDYPHHITSEWMTGYRARRIEQMIGTRERHSIEDFERMQLDFLSLPGIETVHRLSRLQPRSQRAVRAIERLKSWDGRLDAETVAGTIFHAFTIRFARAIVTAAVDDPRLIELYLNKSAVGLLDVVSSPWRFQERLIALWDEGDRMWFASPQHPEGRSWNDVALESLEAGLDLLEQTFGRDPGRWRWGHVHEVEFTHPLGSANELLRRLFNRRTPGFGASETVTQIGYNPTEPFRGTWGPVYRMIADLGDGHRSRWQLTTGQSGQPGSRHYDDMIDGWKRGTTNPVLTEEHDVRAAGGSRHLRLDPD
jgi:penicillin amidase